MTEDMFVNLLFKVASGDPSVALMDKLAGIGAARGAHKQMLKNVSKAQKATGNAVKDLRAQGLVRGQGAQTRYAGPQSNTPGKGPSAGKKLDKLQRTPTKELQAKADDLKAKGVPERKAQNAAGLIPDTPKYSSPEEAWGAKFNKQKAMYDAELRKARAHQGKIIDEYTGRIRGKNEEIGALNKQLAGANKQIEGLNKDLSTARGAFSKQFDLRRQAEGEASRQLARGNRNRNLGIGGTAGGIGLGAGGTALLMKYLGGGAAAAPAAAETAPAASGLAGLASNPNAVAGAAGLAGAGLTYAGLGAIPALRKRKALRAIAALGGGAGLGYAGWKAAQNGLTNVA